MRFRTSRWARRVAPVLLAIWLPPVLVWVEQQTKSSSLGSYLWGYYGVAFKVGAFTNWMSRMSPCVPRQANENGDRGRSTSVSVARQVVTSVPQGVTVGAAGALTSRGIMI